MPKGYVVVNVKVRNAERYPEYAVQAYETVVRFGGKYLTRGSTPEIKEGHPQLARFVILEFPSLADARRWYDSEEYKPIRALRWEWAESELFFVEGFAPS